MSESEAVGTFDAIARVETIQQYIDTLQAVSTETVFEIDTEGIYAEPVDPANAAKVNQWLTPAGFDSYHGGGGLRIGVNLDTLANYLGAGDTDDLVALSLDEESRRLVIELPETEFSMACIDPDSVRNGSSVDDGDIADGFVADVSMDGAALSHATSVVGMVSDHATFDTDPDRETPLHIFGRGDTDDVSVEFSDALHEDSQVDENGESIYSHDYLEELVSPIPDATAVRVRFGDEWPMRWDYEWADGAAEVSMMIAPRIQSR